MTGTIHLVETTHTSLESMGSRLTPASFFELSIGFRAGAAQEPSQVGLKTQGIM